MPAEQMDPEALREQLIAASAKDKLPAAALDPTSPWLPDLEAAVNEAIRRSGKIANNEQSGVIFRNADGHFAYSIPLTSVRQDDFALRAPLAQGQSIAAIWHSHPGADELAGYFSPHDLEMADKLNVPSYIRFNSDGSIRSYTPGKTKTKSIVTGADRFATTKVARGDPVTALPPQLYAEATP
jgi:hypothetical protein